MGKPTAGYDLTFINASDVDQGTVGIVLEFEDSIDGDTEDISGLNDTSGGIVRRKGDPVDVGGQLTFSGKIDTTAAGWSSFQTAMEARTSGVKLRMLDSDGDGWEYTGHADSYSETASRSNAVWDFNCTFYVNSETEITAS